MLNRTKTFWIFSISVFLVILIPEMIHKGMFLDGLTYAAISKNMANGIGTFWNPHYTNTLYPVFYEHPPLVFGIQSIFFKIFGSGFLSENIFSLFNCVLSAFAIILIWNQLFKDSEIKKWAWFPILLWILTPIISWSFKNNLLENSLSLFTLFAIYFQLISIKKNKIIFLIFASFSILFGFLSKGFVALFPLITIWIYMVVFKEYKNKFIWVSGMFTSFFPLFLFILLYFFVPGFHHNFDQYMLQQLIPAIHNQREITTTSHFGLLLYLLQQLLLPILILLILGGFKYFKKINPVFGNFKNAIFFLLIGFAASLPLLITLKQRPFYLVPSIPFFILALSSLVIPFFMNLFKNLNNRFHFVIQMFSILLCCCTLFYSIFTFGKITRDQDAIHDVTLISKYIPENVSIFTNKESWDNWTFTAYLSRYHNISLDCNQVQDFILYPKNESLPHKLQQQYELTNCNLINYKLYKKK